MTISLNKINELQALGYRYSFSNDLYIHKDNKIIISKEAVEDHDDHWLEEQLKTFRDDDWLFIFTNETPNRKVKEKILEDLGLK